MLFMSVYPTVPKLVTVREIDLRQRRTSIVQEKEHRIHLYMKVPLVMDRVLKIQFLGTRNQPKNGLKAS